MRIRVWCTALATPANVHGDRSPPVAARRRVAGMGGYTWESRKGGRIGSWRWIGRWHEAGAAAAADPGSNAALTEKRKASIRAKVEHPFLNCEATVRLCQSPLPGSGQDTQRTCCWDWVYLLTAESRLAGSQSSGLNSDWRPLVGPVPGHQCPYDPIGGGTLRKTGTVNLNPPDTPVIQRFPRPTDTRRGSASVARHRAVVLLSHYLIDGG